MAKRKSKYLQTVTLPIAEAVSEAYGEVAALGEEMRGWADNLEEHFSQTSKYEAVSEAADTLEALEEPEAPAALNPGGPGSPMTDPKGVCSDETISFLRNSRPKQSRADRASGAASILREACERLDELAARETLPQDVRDSLADYRDELERQVDELEAVEFPGMYG